MGAVGHYLEQEGLPTTQVSLVREHTEIIRPPRALWVPFALGRPLGAPHEPQFQRKVLLAALRLLEEDGAPLLRDFDEDAPGGSDDANAQAEACPVHFSRPQVAGSGGHALAQALAEEIAQLAPWHDLASRRRGGSTVGVSGRTPAQAAMFLMSVLGGQPAAGTRADESPALALKYACDDLRAYYEEAAGAQPGPLSGQALERWYYLDTVAGAVLSRLQQLCTASDDPALRRFGELLLIPRAVAHRRPRATGD